jgi:hypothetical protein
VASDVLVRLAGAGDAGFVVPDDAAGDDRLLVRAVED